MSQNQNTVLWDSICKTDPAHTSEIKGKDYKGTSPKPHWLVRRATEVFGPCGLGWGFSVIDERVERFGDVDSIHIARVEFWYKQGDQICKVQHMGQTKMSYMTSGYGGKQSTFKVDEDAPKKSVTDALVKCMSMVGFAGDIFLGRWDDCKYVQEVRQEFAQQAQQQAQQQNRQPPQQQRQAPPQQMDDEYHRALNDIQNAPSRENLAQIRNYFQGAPFFSEIEQAIKNKVQAMGWGKQQGARAS